MLNRITKKLLPEDFTYLHAEWYKALRNKYNNYRYRLLRVILIVTSLIPVFFMILDIVKSDTRYLLNYIIPFICIVTLLVLLEVTKKIDILATIAVICCIIGFTLTLYLPNSRHLSLLIFYCFPFIAFQLRGTKVGALWIVLFIMVAALLYVFQYTGFLPPWRVRFPDNINVVLAAVALALISLITFFGERQHERAINTIIRKILFDETTRHPNKTVLLHSIKKNTNYLFAIIQIVNFNELGLIFGYDLSDEVLLFCSRQLSQWKNEFNYTIYRLKGNEFGILMRLDRCDRGEAYQKMSDLQRLLQASPMPWKNSELRLNIHIGGVAFCSDEVEQSADILSKADLALTSSIENHKGVTLFENHEHIKTSAFQAINLFSTLYKNHEQKTYKAYYQPIVNAATGEVAGYESLLRIRNEEGRYESPISYLPIAESTGLDVNLTRFMIETACAALRHSAKNISVNITFRDMVKSDCVDLLIQHYRQPDPGRGKLILEILERSELSEIEACHRFAVTASRLGCLIAIDDFGSGYSNFENLLTLPVNIIKINGILIQQMLTNVKARRMIENIILFCKQTGMAIIAEWVDSQYLADELKAMGVDYLQGFHFGQPADISWGGNTGTLN